MRFVSLKFETIIKSEYNPSYKAYLCFNLQINQYFIIFIHERNVEARLHKVEVIINIKTNKSIENQYKKSGAQLKS